VALVLGAHQQSEELCLKVPRVVPGWAVPLAVQAEASRHKEPLLLAHDHSPLPGEQLGWHH
jgi:hypothetical protein